MRIALVTRSPWSDTIARVRALEKTISSKLPKPVTITTILADVGEIPADKEGRIAASFLDAKLGFPGFDGAVLLVPVADRKRYGLKESLRGHYLRDEDGYLEAWLVSDRTTKREGKPLFEETFQHELCHGLYHMVGARPTPDQTRLVPGCDNTHYYHNVKKNLDGAFGEIAAAWPKEGNAPEPGRIGAWADAIQEFEGWSGPSARYPLGTRSFRNNNPGNLRYSPFETGQDGGFSKFATYADGRAALVHQLRIAAEGKSKVYAPTDTLLAFFGKYAPSSDGNHPQAYAAFVAGKLGTGVATQIRELLK